MCGGRTGQRFKRLPEVAHSVLAEARLPALLDGGEQVAIGGLSMATLWEGIDMLHTAKRLLPHSAQNVAFRVRNGLPRFGHGGP